MKELLNYPSDKKDENIGGVNNNSNDIQSINTTHQKAHDEGYLDAQNVIKLISEIKDYLKTNGIMMIKNPLHGINTMNISLPQRTNSGIYIYLQYSNQSGTEEGITISLFDDGTLSSDGWRKNSLAAAIGIDMNNPKNREEFKNNIWNVLVSSFIAINKNSRTDWKPFLWENDEKNLPKNIGTVKSEHGGEFDPRISVYEEALDGLVKKFEFGKNDYAYVGIDFIIFTSKEYGKGLYLLPIPESLLKNLTQEEIEKRKDVITGKGIDYKNMNNKQFSELIHELFPNKKLEEGFDIKELKGLIDVESLALNSETLNNEELTYRTNHPDHKDIETDIKKQADFLANLAKGLSKQFDDKSDKAAGKIMGKRRP